MKFFKLKILFLFLFGFQCYSLFSQQLTPPIHNYSSTAYEAASQNWDIDVDEEGELAPRDLSVDEVNAAVEEWWNARS